VSVRICLVSQEFPPVTRYFGGIGTQYGRLAPELARLGHQVTVVTRSDGPATARELEGVHVVALRRPPVTPALPLLWARAVDRAIAAGAPHDVVLAPEFSGEAWRYAGSQRAGPLVTHLLTSSEQLLAWRPGLSWRQRNGPLARLGRGLERSQTARSAALTSPSPAVYEWACELWPEIRALPHRPLPLAIDVAAVRRHGESAPPPGFPTGVPTVTLASRLDDHKGGQYLIAALQRLWPRRPDVHAVFVGREGLWQGRPIREHLSALAGDRADRVVFLGEQSDAGYFGAVAASTMVAIPSLWESFCLAAVEAMALGRPVISTRGHGPDAFARDGENALLVERRAIEPLAEAIERLLDDDALRARIGEAGRRTADRHDAAAVAALYAAAFPELAARA
jgi:glycosyltransferase involved in cell wall biosynthesis